MSFEALGDRRRIVRAEVLVLVLVVLAGCTGGDTSTTHSASPVAVDNATAKDLHYQPAEPRNLTANGSLTIGNDTHTVIVSSYATHYAKAVRADPGEEARFATVTTVASPNVSLGNASLNPIGYANHSEILRTFESNATGVQIGDRVANRSVRVLGARRNVSQFEAVIELGGNGSDGDNATVEVYVHVARFEHEDDHVVIVAAYPRSTPGERESVLAMLRALEHHS